VISIENAKKILCKNGNKFTDVEVRKIKNYLLQLAEINVEHFLKQGNYEKGNFNGKGIKR